MNTRYIQVGDEISGWVYNPQECGSELVTGKVIEIKPYDIDDWTYIVRDNETDHTESIYERNIVKHISI